ncbi:HEAT repeat domain-containing protein [Longimicrobium sp.]|uniref:HEAT repeat domain-containing protein n=1 Tax=Longimicrobium sp. TaxID=2029185 RepID=UPI003B3AD4B1
MSDSIRIPLHPSVSQEDFEAMTYESNWAMESIQQKTDELPFETEWSTRDGKATINYVRDDLLEVDYVVVRGKGARATADHVRSELRTVSVDDALAAAKKARSDDDRLEALYHAVLAAEKADPRVMELMEAALANKDPEVRRGAIFAAGYAEWKALKEPLERVARDDEDAEIREDAEAMLEGLAKVWKSRSK